MDKATLLIVIIGLVIIFKSNYESAQEMAARRNQTRLAGILGSTCPNCGSSRYMGGNKSGYGCPACA